MHEVSKGKYTPGRVDPRKITVTPDQFWLATRTIIDRCVAPDMEKAALEMLEAAMRKIYACERNDDA